MSFDQDVFDRKVASLIVNIHKKHIREKLDKKFNWWVENNIEDLEILHEMSEIECPSDVFYTYVYDNSEIELID